jgi:hypothetical protein
MTHSTNSHFGDVTPFKVQVKFDIPLFEGKININGLEKWLIMLEGYFFVQNLFHSLEIFPMLDIGGKLIVRNRLEINLQFLC